MLFKDLKNLIGNWFKFVSFLRIKNTHLLLQYQFLQGTENRHEDARTEYTFLSLCEFFHEKTDKMRKYRDNKYLRSKPNFSQ